MFVSLFANLREAKVPVSLREYLTLIEAVEQDVVRYDIEAFYFLARAALVKDERHLDRFDQVFSKTFEGLESASVAQLLERADIPPEWVEKLAEKHLSPEERAEIEALG
ncbi:MAG: VWA domain-containing protein, partial [Pseudomonadota bacterium]